ncbi:MAG: PTS transporter subunit EIIC [Pararobbsia sp.]
MLYNGTRTSSCLRTSRSSAAALRADCHGFSCVILGVIFGFIWPPIQTLIADVGNWIVTAGAVGAFVYGVLNRLLLVTGLHHIINSLCWFVFGSYTGADGKVVTGDLHRFFAGDPTAGGFMAGFFPIMMFGLPGACLAMYHAAPKGRRAIVGACCCRWR